MDLRSISKSNLLSLAALAVIIVVTWLPITDHIADADLDKGFNRALASFAIAKGMNMVISLIQSTQVSAQMFMGISISPGELLDPINDLVEQFSNVMLLATVAFGIQKILIGIGGHIIVKTVLSALGVACAWFLFKDRPLPIWIKNALVLAILVRLAVPAATVLSNAAYQIFLEPQYQASMAGLSESSSQLQALNTPSTQPINAPDASPASPSEGNWFSKKWSETKNTVSQAVPTSTADFTQKVNAQFDGMHQWVEKIGEQVTRNIVSQIVVFMLQTLIFPIGLIWILYKVGVSLMYRRTP